MVILETTFVEHGTLEDSKASLSLQDTDTSEDQIDVWGEPERCYVKLRMHNAPVLSVGTLVKQVHYKLGNLKCTDAQA